MTRSSWSSRRTRRRSSRSCRGCSSRTPTSEGPMAEPSIRPYRPSELEDVRTVCFETGFMGEPIEWQLYDREVFCELFCDPHVSAHPDSAWVVDLDGRAVGYLIGSPDTRGPRDARTPRPFDIDAYPADLHINLLPAA